MIVLGAEAWRFGVTLEVEAAGERRLARLSIQRTGPSLYLYRDGRLVALLNGRRDRLAEAAADWLLGVPIQVT